MQTEKLSKTQTNPDTLLENFIDQASPQARKNLKQLLKKTHIRKKLIHNYTDNQLKKLIPTLSPKAYQKILPHINKIISLQYYPSARAPITKQDFRTICCNFILNNLTEKEKLNEKTWLFKTLSALVNTLASYQNTFPHTLIPLTQELLNTEENHDIPKMLIAIRKNYLKNLQKQIKKSLPKHPLLPELYELLTTGSSDLQKNNPHRSTTSKTHSKTAKRNYNNNT